MTTQSTLTFASKSRIGHYAAVLAIAMFALPGCGSEGTSGPAEEMEVSLKANLVEIDNVQTESTTNTPAASPAGQHGAYGAHNCLVPGPFDPYFAGEEVYVFKSTRSTEAPYLDPTACNGASFTPNVIAGARMTSMKYRQEDAQVGDPLQEEIGMGTLCFNIPDFTFPAFNPPLPVHGRVTINGITLEVDGECLVANHAFPAPGVHLLSCAIPVVNPPPEYSGGLLTTNSVFNIAGVPGFSTGSILTLHLYNQ